MFHHARSSASNRAFSSVGCVKHMRGDADAVAAAGGPALLVTLEF
jgi:hypothetical protein